MFVYLGEMMRLLIAATVDSCRRQPTTILYLDINPSLPHNYLCINPILSLFCLLSFLPFSSFHLPLHSSHLTSLPFFPTYLPVFSLCYLHLYFQPIKCKCRFFRKPIRIHLGPRTSSLLARFSLPIGLYLSLSGVMEQNYFSLCETWQGKFHKLTLKGNCTFYHALYVIVCLVAPVKGSQDPSDPTQSVEC